MEIISEVNLTPMLLAKAFLDLDSTHQDYGIYIP